MMLNVLFKDSDVEKLSEIRKEYELSTPDYAQLVANAEQQLREAGFDGNATVDLVRRKNGGVCWGSSRIPLRVQHGDRQFVIKSYDNYNKEREKNILRVVEGKIAPCVIYFGNDFYAEEFVDHSRAVSLEDLADAGDWPSVVKKGGEMHADLAKLGINYDHSHWLDEFHIRNDDKPLVTDFGTSTYFLSRGECSRLDERLKYLETEGDRKELFREFQLIPCFGDYRPCYEETRETLMKLAPEDNVRFLNLLRVLSQSIAGIKQYLERKHGFKIRAWDRAMELFPDFVKAFSDRY